MGFIIKVIRLAVIILPLIVELVRAIEHKGEGAEKKKAVLALVAEMLSVAVAPVKVMTKVMDIADHAIDIVVAVFNVTGEFDKDTD